MSTTSNTSFKNGLPRLPASLAALCLTHMTKQSSDGKQGLEAAIHLFEGWDLGSNEASFGAEYPQATQDAVTKVPFEHDLPTDYDFTWNFYIGKEGFQSPSHDIIPTNQLASHGISVKIEVPSRPAEEVAFGVGLETVITRELGKSRWEAIDLFSVSLSTVVRMEYNADGIEHCEDCVFASDPDTSSSRRLRVL